MKSLFGYGIVTKEIAKEGNWHIFDDKFKTIKKDIYGNTLMPSKYFKPEISSLEITSAGIPPSNPLIKKAKNLISELDYCYKNNFQIWLTGTNGKTTTTQMIHFLLKNSEIGGNIGIPLKKLNPNKKWVIEVSSFQLYYTKYAKPNIFVILPIKEDHISWHGSFENYVKAKLSPLQRMNERDIVIMPSNFNYPTKAYKITYQNADDLIKKFDFKNIYFKEPFKLDEVLAKVVYYILYFKEASLKNFKIDPHKVEEFKDSLNRIWVDDSKATNVDATINALKRYKNKEINLILGGDSKNQDLTPLFEELKNYKVKIYLIGKDIKIFEKFAKKYNIDYELSFTLKNAVEKIKKEFKDIAILSPAAASLDQFKSYKERGEIFKKLSKI